MKARFEHQPGRLQLWLFGPGTGELVVVHVPPAGWLVVDGCAPGGESWAVRFFEHMAARPALRIRPTHVLLSHPHLDHAAGVTELIDWCFSQGHAPRLAAVPRPSTRRVSRDDLAKSVAAGQALAALNAIGRWWKRRPTTKWPLRAGREVRLGGGRLWFLSPEQAVVHNAEKRARQHKPVSWNELASALLLRWGRTRVVLGSDLTDNGWPAALKRTPKGELQVLKVAHHGSRGAQSPQLLARFQPTAQFMCTPFAREDLPRFADAEGAHLLLQVVPQLHLTGLPHAHDQQANRPRRFARPALAADVDDFIADDGPRGFPDSWVKLCVDANGRRTFAHGPGSVIVTR